MYHIDDYLNWLKVRGLSKATIKHRYEDLNKFKRFLIEEAFNHIKNITTKELYKYLTLLLHEKSKFTKKKRSIISIRSYLITVKQYFKYLYDNGYIIYNPAEKLDLPKQEKSLPKGILTELEINKLLNLANTKTYQGYLDKMIMEILYSTGIRNRELVNLEIYDIDFEERTVRIREGKGKKDRFVPIGETALKMIQEYLYMERLKVAGHTEKIRLLLNEKGNSLQTHEVWKMIKYYVQKAGIKKQITPHSLRHTFSIHLLKNGADIMSIKEMLGHSCIRTTQLYLRIQNPDLKNVHDKFHPREKLKINKNNKFKTRRINLWK